LGVPVIVGTETTAFVFFPEEVIFLLLTSVFNSWYLGSLGLRAGSSSPYIPTPPSVIFLYICPTKSTQTSHSSLVPIPLFFICLRVLEYLLIASIPFLLIISPPLS